MASTSQVTGLYQELLGRAPDAGGLKFYSGFGDVGAIRRDILGSTEYKSRSASTPSAAPAPAGSTSLTQFAQNQKVESDALLNRQKGEQEGLFSNYDNIRKNQEALPLLYQRLQNEAGIPELSRQAQGFKNEIFKVKGILDRLPEDITARTTGTLTTDSQRRRLENVEGEGLRNNLGRLGTGLEPIVDMLNGANSSVSNLMQLNVQQQDRALEPVKLRIGAISDRFAREMTGFTTSKESELTALTDKITRDRFLSDREWELAQTLAAEERQFSRQKSLAASQISGGLSMGGGGGGGAPAPTAPAPAPKPALGVSDYLNSGKKLSANAPGLTPLSPNGGLTWLSAPSSGSKAPLPKTPLPSGNILSGGWFPGKRV